MTPNKTKPLRKDLELLARVLAALGGLLRKDICLRVSTQRVKFMGKERSLTGMDVRKNTTLGDRNVSEKLVQLLIIANGELKVTRDDTGFLVVAGSVASEFENLGSEVLENGSEVDRCTYAGLAANFDASRSDYIPAPTR